MPEYAYTIEQCQEDGHAYALERDQASGKITAYSLPLTYRDVDMYRHVPETLTEDATPNRVPSYLEALNHGTWTVLFHGGNLRTDQPADIAAPVGSGATIIGVDGTMLPCTVTMDRINAAGRRQITIQVDAVREDGGFERDPDEFHFTVHHRDRNANDYTTEPGVRWRTLEGHAVHFGQRRSHEPAEEPANPAVVSG